MSHKKKTPHFDSVYITTPIFYVNDKPHIGHAYTDVVADCVARLYALNGKQVRMQTGTDEHGQKILKSAEAKGANPILFCNDVSKHFYNLAVDLNCICSYPDFNAGAHFNMHPLVTGLRLARDGSNSGADADAPVKFGHGGEEFRPSQLFAHGENFIRTTEGRDPQTGEITPQSLSAGRHVKAVVHFWNKLVQNGWIYKSVYSGWYAVRDEAFYAENELVDGKAPTGAEVVWKSEEAYFFALSKFQRMLLDLYRKNDIVKPHDKFTEIISFLSGIDFASGVEGKMKEGHLQDLCVSRVDMAWGIPVPNDERHSIYVWIDALVNYLSAIHYPAEYSREFWANSKTIHVVGKDIIRFHCVYWPAMLVAEMTTVAEFDAAYGSPSRGSESGGSESEESRSENNSVGSAADGAADGVDGRREEFLRRCVDLLPKEIFAHGWWTNEGQKISKSLGNVIDPLEEIDAIANNYGIDKHFAVDYLRFSLLHLMPLGNDGDYSREQCWKTIDSLLCGNVGNLINRVFSMIKKNCDLEAFFGQVAPLQKPEEDFFLKTHLDLNGGMVDDLFGRYEEMINDYKIFEMLKATFQMADRCNSYIESVAPWALAKNDPERLPSVLQVLYVQIVLVMQSLRFLMQNFVERFFDYIDLDLDLRRVPTVNFNKGPFEIREGASAADSLLQILKAYGPKNKAQIDMFVDLPIFFQKSLPK